MRNARPAFTLVELLVVIGVIAILLAILLPALSRARDSANRISCASQNRQVLTALQLYANESRGFLPDGYWGSANFMGSASKMVPLMGGGDDPAKVNDRESIAHRLLQCPSYAPVDRKDFPRYYKSIAPGGSDLEDVLHMTYIYVGGRGMGNENVDAGNWWFGWNTYSDPFTNENYDDPQFLGGPSPKITTRRRSSEVAILTDRMWTEGNAYWPLNAANWIGLVAPNHQEEDGATAGGNAGFLDGHVEWRDASVIEHRVKTYGITNPLVCY